MTPTWEELSDEGEHEQDTTPTAPSTVAPGAVVTHSSFGSTSAHESSIWVLDSRDGPISRQSTTALTQPRSPLCERGTDQLASLVPSGPAPGGTISMNRTFDNTYAVTAAVQAGAMSKAAAVPLEDSLRLLTLNNNVAQHRQHQDSSDPSSALAAAAGSSSTLAQLVAQAQGLGLSATSTSSLRQNPFQPLLSSTSTTPLAQGSGGSTVTPRTVYSSAFGFSLGADSSSGAVSLTGTAPTPTPVSTTQSSPGMVDSPANVGLGFMRPLFTPYNQPSPAYPHQSGSQGTPRSVATLMSPFTPDGPGSVGETSTSEPSKGAAIAGVHMPRINLGCQL
jgi:hypothetical protein